MQAVLLAAATGTRGLLRIEGETLVGRSIRLLRAVGVTHVTIVVGEALEVYQQFAAASPDIRIAQNDRSATTGGMASLAVALDKIQDDVLVLDANIVYEPRALTAIVDSVATDAVLLSAATDASKMLVYAPGGRVHTISEHRDELPEVTGEFVGITRLSAAAATAMRHAFSGFVDVNGHARMDYETDGLGAVARLFPLSAIVVADLRWAAIDDERHAARVVHAGLA